MISFGILLILLLCIFTAATLYLLSRYLIKAAWKALLWAVIATSREAAKPVIATSREAVKSVIATSREAAKSDYPPKSTQLSPKTTYENSPARHQVKRDQDYEIENYGDGTAMHSSGLIY